MFAFVIGCIGVYLAFEIICGILASIAVVTDQPGKELHPNAPQLGKVGSFFVMSAVYLTLFSLLMLLGFLLRP